MGGLRKWWEPHSTPQAVASLKWSEGEDEWPGRLKQGRWAQVGGDTDERRTGGKTQKVYASQKGEKKVALKKQEARPLARGVPWRGVGRRRGEGGEGER